MSEQSPLNGQFINRIKDQIDDSTSFFDVIEGEELTSIRLNSGCDLEWEAERVPWNDNGRYLSERPGFNRDPLFHAGGYYPMEASSMFLNYVLKQIDLDSEAVILDLCAAPGGKSLILKDHFPDHLLISNEIDGKRVHILKENAVKWGTRNHVVVQSEAAKLTQCDLQYGLVLVDAPCSGEGLFRKDKSSRVEWTFERAAGCALRQNQILDDTVDLIEKGGYLIYSTCTYNPQENMDQLLRLVNEYEFEPVQLTIDDSLGIEEIKEAGVQGFQFWPHRLKGEGFFISVLRKKGEESIKHKVQKGKIKSSVQTSELLIPADGFVIDLEGRYYLMSEDEIAAVDALKRVAKILKKGVFLGEIKGKELIPSYDASHQKDLIQNYPHVDLDETQALNYLQGNALMMNTSKGPVVLTYKNLALGMGKSNGQRINNLYPKHLRIT